MIDHPFFCKFGQLMNCFNNPFNSLIKANKFFDERKEK